jgi:hypothetical protein
MLEIGSAIHLADDWCNYAHEPEHAIDDPKFHDLVKKVVDAYLKEVV